MRYITLVLVACLSITACGQSKSQKEFIGKGLPYYEYSFEFDAKVPYEFEGWTNGIDSKYLALFDGFIVNTKIVVHEILHCLGLRQYV